MKLQDQNYGFDGMLPDEASSFKIKTSAKLFNVLSSGLYPDKIMAVIRELSCNAHDAHIAAKKKDVPFKIQVPNYLDPVFAVEDEGTGIEPSKIVDVYCTYGESSKTDDQEQIGALGLGSKSPFAYTKSSFILKNRYDGVEYSYFCFINANGCPDISPVGEEPTNLPNGVRVELAVRKEDITEFKTRIGRFFRRWAATLPVFSDGMVISPVQKAFSGNEWYLETAASRGYANASTAIAMQGNVPYPIDDTAIPNFPEHLKLITSNNFVITFDMGEVNFTASRETLEYDERTCRNVIDRLQEVFDDFKAVVNHEAFVKPETKFKFMTSFKSIMDVITNNVCYKDSNGAFHQMDVNAACEFFFNAHVSDEVSFQGSNYELDNLINRKFNFKIDGYADFNIQQTVPYGKNRMIARGTAEIEIETIDDFQVIYDTAKRVDENGVEVPIELKHTFKAGSLHYFAWRSKNLPKTASNANLQTCVIRHAEKFNFNTVFSDLMITANTKFVFNDCASAGNARVKALKDKNIIFIDFDPKDQEVAFKQFNDLFKKYFEGASFANLSALPDNRAVKEKSVRKVYEITLDTVYWESSTTSSVGVIGHDIKYLVFGNPRIMKQTFDVNDLAQLKQVIYVSAKRGDVKTKIDGSRTVSRSGMGMLATFIDQNLMDSYENITHTFTKDDELKLFKTAFNAGRKLIQIISIANENQLKWLELRGVNLISFETYMKNKLIELNNHTDFFNIISKFSRETNSIIETMISLNLHKLDSNDKLPLIDETINNQLEAWTDFYKQRKNKSLIKLCKYMLVAQHMYMTDMFVYTESEKDNSMMSEDDFSAYIEKEYQMFEFRSFEQCAYSAKNDSSGKSMRRLVDYMNMCYKAKHMAFNHVLY